MRHILPLLVFVACATQLRAQTTITGKIVDTGDNKILHQATISVINPPDSVLLKFTRSAEDGTFTINNIPAGSFLVLITYPGYADYLDQITDSSKNNHSLGIIPLTKKSELLEAVIVQRKLAAIRMRGDTLAFLADSFSVRQGATVDELLKQLPGIQVDRNGAITAQGEKVNKVLVDGEEFFSDDPAVVIKNLQAEAVKEVQVFDKKSEQAEFSGIDDGQRSKTINLTLKPDKKKGYFAKATLNGGTKSSFDNDIMLNYFKGTRKIAAFGIASNTGRQGLDWNEMDRFGGGINVEYNEEEGFFVGSMDDDEFSRSMNSEEGLPAAWSAGFHFSDKWRGENNKLNANYRFLKKNLSADGTTRTQYILPDTQYFNDQSRKSFNSKIGHQVKAISEIKFDSLTSMKITIRGSLLRNETASSQQSKALNADSGLVNQNDRLLSGIMDKNDFNANILLRKRFLKTGRTLSVNVEQKSSYDRLDGLLQSTTNYYNFAGENDSTEILDQKKNNRLSTFGIKAIAVYTEPLSKSFFLSVNYGINHVQSDASRNSFNKGASDIYDKRDSLFSNDFEFIYNIHSAGADLRFNRKKINILLGSGINLSTFNQQDVRKDSSSTYSFTNFFPKFSFRYSPKQYTSISFRYNGRTNPPALDQLQPVRENTDPLNIQLGNASLRQEFIHTLQMTYQTYQVLDERGVYFSTNANLYENAITMATNVDKGGKTTFQPINVNGRYNVSIYTGFNMKLKKPGIYISMGPQVSLNRTTNIVNGLDNVNTYRNYNLYSYISKSKNDKYSFSIRPSLGYTFNKSSLRPDVVTKYFTSESGADMWVKLPSKFEIWSEATFAFRQKTEVFENNRNAIRWDASLSRRFLKNNNLELKLKVYDLLNQNIGFSRIANSNLITENSYITLRRRLMIGIQYNISKNP